MDYYFQKLSFPKKGSEIKVKAKERIKKLMAKTEERKRLISVQAKELGIDIPSRSLSTQAQHDSVEDALTSHPWTYCDC